MTIVSAGVGADCSLHSAIDNLGLVLQPVLDVIYETMGLCATMIVAGPWPSSGGRIEART